MGESGKYPLVFKQPPESARGAVSLPCGQCVGCRLERSRQWAMRCMHEASLYEDNCFLTLTVRDSELAEYDCSRCGDGSSLCMCRFQKFMKRLRFEFSGKTIRFFHCGEYGDTTLRPHYHACLFNFDVPDRKFYKMNELGMPLYTSKLLERVWGHGFVIVGDVTFESAAYVARYVMKKITGEKADTHYNGRRPEYVTMSRRPGIGKGWFEKFGRGVYARDSVVVRGRECRPPRFYDGLFEVVDPVRFAKLKAKRAGRAERKELEFARKVRRGRPGEFIDEDPSYRLGVEEKCKVESLKLLRRDKELG